MLEPQLYLNDDLILDTTHLMTQKKEIQNISFKKSKGQNLKLIYFVPLLDLQLLWHPLSDGVVFLKNEWDEGVTTRLNQSLPLLCLLNQNNQSLFSLALDELVNEVELTVGVHEESASVKITIETIIPTDCYDLQISIMMEEKQWSEVVHKQIKWLYQESGVNLPRIPESSFEPVLSTWYSFHQQVTEKEILDESMSYKEIGAETLILDDGWQTDDSSRRYAYAGDWQVSMNKFPNFKKHVKEVQELEMNYLVWLSIPYIGKQSQNWEVFKNNLLYIDEFQKAGILDIRQEKVQTYLVNTMESFVDTYGINGLKIDFLEMFFLEGKNSFGVGKGLLSFLEKMKASLMNKENFLIEFRQDYINPLMMQYCQIVRSKDCPNNYILNRIRTIDLRLSCPFTAVHSDMIMWHPDEKIEDAALHIINGIFSVPQLSMKYEELSLEEIKMITFWLSFTKKYQSLLLKSHFEPLYPQEGYSVVRVSELDRTLVAVFGEEKVIDSTEIITKQRLFINGTKRENLFITLPKGDYTLTTKDCLGQGSTLKYITLSKAQSLILEVPKSGVLIIDTE